MTVVRGWITRWSTQTIPVPIGLHVFVEVPLDELGQGEHEFSFRITSPSDIEIVFLAGKLQATQTGARTLPAAFPIQFAAPEVGEYVLALSCGPVSGTGVLRLSRSE
jgi:hypothetical protein